MPTYAATQDGYHDLVTLIPFVTQWNEGATTLIVSDFPVFGAGLYFPSFPVATMAGGTVRADSVLRTATLRIELQGAVAGRSLDVGMVPQNAPAVYSALALPHNRDEIVVATYVVPQNGTFVAEIPLDVGTMVARQQTLGWAGTFALSLFATNLTDGFTITANEAGGNVPQLVTEESPWDSGLDGQQYVGRGVLTDPKTGQWFPRDMAVRDGYLRGRRVHPDNFDPEDERTDRRRLLSRRRERVPQDW